MDSLRIICPNGHLGFAPLRVESFRLGVAARPNYIAADSGSDDVGPIPLATDTSTSPLDWQTHDLEHMLLASRKLGVPMIIGSSGDTGANSRVDLYVRIVKELAAKHGLARFKLGYFYSEVDREELRRRMRAGETVPGLEGHPELTESEVDATERIVAMAGVHPFIALLKQGADVHRRPQQRQLRVCRARDSPRLSRGPGVLPGQGARVRVVLRRTLRRQGNRPGRDHPGRRRSDRDASGAALHGGVGRRPCDVRTRRYEQVAEKTTRVTGAKFRPADEFRVKLEGAGRIGERYVGMVGIRDPYTIAHVNEVIDWARDKVRERFGDGGYELHYTVYGRDGVMGELEPLRERPAHELCILVQGVAPTAKVAEEVCLIGTRHMFYARLPDVKGSAGSVAFALDEVLRASPACRWTLNHTLRCRDPLELFPTHMTAAGG